MAVRKPLVVIDGQICQLQPGDIIEYPGLFAGINNNSKTITIGQPTYVDGSGTVDLAQANSSSTKDVLGLVSDASIAPGASGGIQSDSILTATTAEWDAVTGQEGGLTPGDKYYLDPSIEGKLTVIPPKESGNFLVPVGIAASTEELEITIGTTIKL